MIGLPKEPVYAVASRLLLNFAAMAFLGVTLFLTWQSQAWPQLFSLRGLVFALGGVIASGALVGAVLARMHQLAARWIIQRNNGSLDERSAAAIRWGGTMVLLAQVLAVYYLTLWAFERWIAIVPA